MSGIITELSVAARLGARATARRLRHEVAPAPDSSAFGDALQGLLTRAPTGLIHETRCLKLSVKQPPWVGTGLLLQAGDEVSFFVAGRVYASRALDIWLNPALQLWSRVGARGEVFRGTRSSHSFRVNQPGELFFGNYFPNDWADRTGARRLSDDVYNKVSGQLHVVVVRWVGDALAGLQQLVLRSGDYQGYFEQEIARLELGDTTPPGWSYLWNVGPAEIYQSGTSPSGGACIHCCTRGDVGILQYPVDLTLEPGTELSWSWCVSQLPSDLREDTVPSHDYLSIAVEFDNGRDITYYWSSTLAGGTGYDCPLPAWRGKEYHVVVRSGTADLKQWLQERRDLYADYRQYMGEPPSRVVKVWLIANSVFQRNPGVCDYADIVIHHKDGDVQIL
jgi:hypothetical protein